ncbi:hypothetical protein ACN9JG_20995 (plasmid) [Cereibacter azotoformans]|uniref:hypothetical protein n=1 Tax=Cereibacter TaxID=1653176 RepID=UPI0016426E54|nr:hypothetical protein [Cereibacter sediminicola]
MGLPLLEIYSPIREVWSGEIIAIAEFYEIDRQLAHDLAASRCSTWLEVDRRYRLPFPAIRRMP